MTTIVRGPCNYVHLRKGDKNIYVVYEIHSKGGSHEVCPPEWSGQSIDVVQWIKRDFLPKYTKDNKLDIFVEMWIFEKERFEVENASSLDKIRHFITHCDERARCHAIDIRAIMCSTMHTIMEINETFYSLYDDIMNWIKFSTEHNNIGASDSFHGMLKKLTIGTVNTMKKIFENMLIFIDQQKTNIDPRLIQSRIYQKIYDKLDKNDKEYFVQLNTKTKDLIAEFMYSAITYFRQITDDPTIEQHDKNILQFNDTFSSTNEIPTLNNFDQVTSVYTAVTSKLMDVYVIGRLLKLYVKDCLIYVGAEHGKNIVKELISHGFEVVYKANDIAYPNSVDSEGQFIHCMKVN